MAMSRKDYQALAEDIKHAHERWIDSSEQDIAKKVLQGFLSNFMEYLKEDNARFDEHKFVEACGLDSH